MSKTIVNLTKTCSACPTQYEGELANGDYIYIRYRYGSFSISVANKMVHQCDFGDSLDGAIDSTESYFMISRAGFKFTKQAKDRILNGW